MSQNFIKISSQKISYIVFKLINKIELTQAESIFFDFIVDELKTYLKQQDQASIINYLTKNSGIYPMLAKEILRINKLTKTFLYSI